MKKKKPSPTNSPPAPTHPNSPTRSGFPTTLIAAPRTQANVRFPKTNLLQLADEDEPTLVQWDPFLVLDLGLDVVNGVRALNLKSDGLASEGLDEDWHLWKTIANGYLDNKT